MDEFSLIDKFFRPLAAGFSGSLGLTDDAALLAVPAGQHLIITADALVAGVHFTGDEDAGAIGQKALRVNLSDLAAKGATPLCYFLTLSLPTLITEAWLARFVAGLAIDQKEYAIALAGGDTTNTPGPLTVSITALGTSPQGAALLRSGAQAGDDIYVSGTIGDAALGLKVVRGELPENAFLRNRYLLPQPRTQLGQQLRGIASACMDISDGLVQDLGHICTASGVGATIHAERVPITEPFRDQMEKLITGGDDYELLFTAPPAQRGAIDTLSQKLALPLTRIGEITSGNKATVLQGGTEMVLKHTGYRHFS